jgi:hypothetical protein
LPPTFENARKIRGNRLGRSRAGPYTRPSKPGAAGSSPAGRANIHPQTPASGRGTHQSSLWRPTARIAERPVRWLGRFVTDPSTGQVRADGHNANTFDGSPEQGAEMPLIAGQKMAAIRMDGSSQDRLIFCRESDPFR